MTVSIAGAARLLICAATLASTGACATAARGTKEMYRVESTPPGASVRTSHGRSCTTPCQMELPRREKFDVTVSLEGYKPFSMRVTNEVSSEGAAGVAGNILFLGGIGGVVVDTASGAALDLKPNPLVVQLEPEGSQLESRRRIVVRAPVGN